MFSHIQVFPIDYLYFKLKRKQEEILKVECPSDSITSHRLQSTENKMETISSGRALHNLKVKYTKINCYVFTASYAI